MDLLEIAERGLVIKLDPEEAQRFAIAFKIARRVADGDYGVEPPEFFDEEPHNEAANYYAMAAAAFESAGMASVAYSYVPPRQFGAEFTLENVRKQSIGVPLWSRQRIERQAELQAHATECNAAFAARTNGAASA